MKSRPDRFQSSWLWLLLAGSLLAARAVRAEEPAPDADCNSNGVPDERDVDPLFRWKAPEALIVGGLAPRDVAAVDIDADGLIDIVTANLATDNVSILFGEGDRKYSAPVVLATGSRPSSLAVGDLDGDSKLDIAAGNAESREISVLLQGSRRTFHPPRSVALEENPVSFAAGDFDGDGDADIAAATAFGISILVREAATWTVSVDFPLGTPPIDLVAADLDGDGDLDLATANTLGNATAPDNVSVLRQGERGAFVAHHFATGRGATSIAPGDIDGDGDIDLVTANVTDRSLAILSNEGEAIFARPRYIETDLAPAFVVAADFNRDGRTDVAACLSTGFSPNARDIAVIHWGQGDGILAAGTSISVGRRTRLAAADLDADGEVDLVAASDWGYATLLWNAGDARFEAEENRPDRLPVDSTWGSLTTGDADGDGDTDLVAGASTDGLVLFRNDGGGGMTPEPQAFVWPGSPRRVESGDIDSDRDLDLIAIFAGGGADGLGILRNDGDGKFGTPELTGLATECRDVRVGDLDGDGFPDLALAMPLPGNIQLFWNDRAGSFVEGPSAPAKGGVVFLAATDLEGDGDLDLVAANGGTGLAILRNRGGREFADASLLGTAGTAYAVATADLDRDGDIDLAASTSFEDLQPEVTVLLQQVGGTFVPAARIRVPKGATDLVSADLDGDRDSDLAVSFSGLIGAFLNDGRGTFRLGTLHDISTLPHRILIADLNGDGRPELIGGVGSVAIVASEVLPAGSSDANGNRIPDECEGTLFHRGDATGDGGLNITDGISLLDTLFLGGRPQACADAADANDDGKLELTDAVAIFQYLFASGEAPADPGPPPAACGPDPGDHDGLGCDAYAGC